MPDLVMTVDTALSEVPVNLLPLLDSTDFVSRETAIVYNQAGMDLVWNFVTVDGSFTQTAVTPSNSGNYLWTNQGKGYYSIQIPDSGGADINNNAAGFGWFTGVATGVLPWRGPTIQFSPAQVVNSLVLGSDKLQVHADEITANLITATAIANDAITAAKIADNAIDAGAIATGAITAAKFAAGAIDAAAIAADAITDAKVASDVTIASVTGAVGSVTGNVGGNVGGNVTGSVGSIATGGITTASFAAGAINAAAIAADAITDAKVASDVTIASVTGAVGSVTGAVGSVTGAVGSVTGNVGGNVVGSVGSVTTVSDKTGYRLSATGVDDVWDEAMSGHTTAGTFGDKIRAHAAAVLKALVTTGSTTTTVVLNATTGIEGAAPSATDDFYNGRVIVFITGSLAGQATDITDYTGSSQTLTVTALTGAPSSGDTAVIV